MKHTFNLNGNAIRLIVSHEGKKYKRATGISIDPKLWNPKGKTAEKRCLSRDAWKELGPINARLVERELTAKTDEEVVASIEYAITGDETRLVPSSVSLWDYFNEWSQRDTPTRRFRRLAYERIAEIMGTKDNWMDINGDWYFRFIQKCDALDYSHNYKSTLTARFKTMLSEAFKREIHANEAFRKFRTSYRTADTIALTQAEVDSLWNAKLKGKDADARDVFIMGVYCAWRYQDYSKLSEENIVDGNLRYVQRKTMQTVIIPCSSRIKAVFARNGGTTPKITEQEVGRHIKRVCKNIGGSFDDVVEVKVSKGNTTVIEKKHRWEMVSTHTARRTGASILYKSGVPIALCRQLTGHTTDEMFMKYLKIGKEEAAELLAKSDFFK